MKSVTILGSTGSIGESALRVIRDNPDRFRVLALTCNRNIKKLSNQIEEFRPHYVAVADNFAANSCEFSTLKETFPEVEFFSGDHGVLDAVSREVDVVVSAVVGAAGLLPSVRALDFCKRMALANKETLVMAGSIFTKMAQEKGVELIPVDSEHSAIFSMIKDMNIDSLDRLLVTASGGSLRDVPVEKFPGVTPEEALNHPTWSMGGKITIDSATLMNKGLEVIEAHYLFDVSYDSIDVIVHPESIVHSMVETVDGSVYAHMGVADMAIPIANALTFPEKVENNFGKLDLVKTGSLTFRGVDPERYPSLGLCYDAGRSGGIMPAVLNAANEVAVNSFLSGRIGFDKIYGVVDSVLNRVENYAEPSLEEITEYDRRSRGMAEEVIKELML